MIFVYNNCNKEVEDIYTDFEDYTFKFCDFDELEQFLRHVKLGDKTRITIPQPKMNMIIITKPEE